MSDRTFRTTGGLALEPEIDLEACHREPIHRTALIQPHGTLLGLDPAEGRVQSAAANVEVHLGRPPRDVVGSGPGEIFPSATAAWLTRWLERPGHTTDRRVVDVADGSLLLRVFPSGETVGLEVERVADGSVETGSLVLGTLPVLERLRGLDSREALSDACVDAVRSVTGFDRVMLYRFDEAGHGSVVAEDRAPGVESYLGLHFPASDIPEPARRLYRKNVLRYIPDVDEEPVPLVGADGDPVGRTPDLTFSLLRNVPDVHRQYLRNMGVRSSVSVPLLVDGDLWGLIACHAEEPRSLGWAQRHACELVGHSLGQQLERARAEARSRRLGTVEGFRDRLDAFRDTAGFFDRLRDARDELLSLLDATGFYVRFGSDELWLGGENGEGPPGGLIDHLVACLEGEKTAAVRSIAGELDASWESSRVASGFLAARIGQSGRHFCAWIRPEQRETVRWGGDPRRPAERDAAGELTPRGSFETWTQVVAERCRAWTELDRITARAVVRFFDEVLIELQSHRLVRIDEERRELMRQLSERARTDELTGLANRGELERRLEEELERARRYGSDLSVALIDLDHFKQVNDRHGHRAGDRVLERYGGLLEENLRAADTAGRYGGEEFALVLPETDVDEAAALLERILADARGISFRADGSEFRVTCSAGVTAAGPGDEAIDRLLDRADEALYRAKEGGRDRVVAAPPGEET